jgi:CubicO group peptidase (beta-lactamase class C family)
MWNRTRFGIAFTLAAILGLAAFLRADDIAPLKAKILDVLKETGVASICVAVARDGKIVWEEAFGWADRERMIKATPNTMYSLASVSKPLTASGLMVLADRKLVNIDRPIDDYLGGVKITAFEKGSPPATVRNVLNHSAGLPLHYQFFYENEPDRRPPMEETIRRYGIQVWAPGEVYFYSNLGYGIIDHVIAKVSGREYADFMRTEVFLPLDMTRTSVGIGPGLAEFAAQRYDGDQKPIPFYDFDHPGASAVYSSAHDLVRFGMFHLKNHLTEQKSILKDAVIDGMQDEAASTAPEKNYAIGWGVSKDENGYRTISHTGGMPGVSTELKLVPSENIAVCVLANGSHNRIYSLADDILSVLLPKYGNALKARMKPEERGPAKFTPSAELLGTWSGRLRTYEGETPLTIVFQSDGDIHVKLGDGMDTLLNPLPAGVSAGKGILVAGVTPAQIPTADAGKHPHTAWIALKLKGGKLTGFAAAMNSRWSALSSYIELKKS